MIRPRKYLWMVVGAISLAAIGKFTAKPLWAQIKAALVQNIDEPGRNPYIETEGLSGQCAPCIVKFQPVPAGKRLVVTHLTGNVFVASGGDVTDLFVDDSPRDILFDVPTLQPVAVSPSFNRVGVSATILGYFEAGHRPQINLATSTPLGGAELTLSGYFVSVP